MTDVKKAKSKLSAAKSRAAQGARAAKTKAGGPLSKQTSGFVEFIRNQGIVATAIGLAIGTIAGGTVKTIVESFVTPIVNFLVGTQDKLEVQVWHFELWGRQANFKWGAGLSALISLVATVFVIYLLVRFARLDKLKKQD